MKHINLIIIAFIIFSFNSLQGQEPVTAGPIQNFAMFQNKLKKSDADIQDPKKNIKAKTWTNRAELLIKIYNIHNDAVQKQMEPMFVKLIYGEPKEIQTTSSEQGQIETYVYDIVNLIFVNGKLDKWVETKKVHEAPLPEAAKAVTEAVKLNIDGKGDKDIIDIINSLKPAFENEAITAFEKESYQLSYDNFMGLLSLNEFPLMNHRIDTLDIYYAGRAAFENKNFKEASRLFDMAASYNFKDPLLCIFRKQSYFAMGDTANGVKIIQEGFQNHPDNIMIMNEMINYYVMANESEEALKLIALGKASDPSNATYWLVEGALYDRMNRFEDSENAYKECIVMDSVYYDAIFNLGVLYYNNAVKIYEKAARTVDYKEYNKVQLEADEMLKMSVPYLQKADMLQPNDRVTLETMKTIFYRLKMTAEYDDVVSKLNAL
jgi:tetratricopeptide (TPR) repeat protein